MENQVFADGIGNIAIVGSTVRFDLVALSAVDTDENGKPRPVFVQRLVLPAENFLAAVEKLQGAAQALQKLITAAKGGGLTVAPAAPAAEHPASPAPAAPAKPPFP